MEAAKGLTSVSDVSVKASRVDHMWGFFLRQQPWNHIAVDIREAEVASCVAVSQAFVVKAQI